jgi:hypothetical protein
MIKQFGKTTFAATVISLASAGSAQSDMPPIKLAPPPTGIYHAAFPDFGPEESIVTKQRVRRFSDKLNGRKIVWGYFSDNWFRGIRFPKNKVEMLLEEGVVPFIRLMPRSNWNEGCVDKKYRMENILSGKFDDKFRTYARTAGEVRGPVMIEFGTEVNGNWFPWSGVCNGGATRTAYGSPALADGPERFRDAYRHIIDIFRAEGVHNVTWVFHVNGYGAPHNESWNAYSAYYPGDDYIDWIGVSVYAAQTPRELKSWNPRFRQVMDDVYPDLEAISSRKPIAVLEFGVVEHAGKPQWLRDALTDLSSGRYPRIKAMSYWHSNWKNDDGSRSRMRLDSSSTALAAYRDALAQPAFIETPLFARGPQLASRHVGIPGFEQAQFDGPTEQSSKDEPADEGTLLLAEWFD